MENKLASSHLTSSHLHLPSAQTAARELSPGTNPLGEKADRGGVDEGGGLHGPAQLHLREMIHSVGQRMGPATVGLN